MKIGVTGATGFIGSHLCHRLRKQGHEVIEYGSASLDIREEIVLPELDLLYHLAANSRVYLARTQPVEDFKTNALGTVNILEAVRKAKIKKVIYVSSVRVYENPRRSQEEDRVGSGPSASFYGISKLVGEYYVRQYSAHFGIHYIIMRLSSPYGPGMRKNPLFDMIKGFINNQPIKIFVDVNSEYDFIYIEDVVNALVLSLRWSQAILNVSDGKPTKLSSIIINLKNLLAREVPIQHGGPLESFVTNNSKIRSLGWKQQYSFEEGLKKTVDYFVNNTERLG